MSRRSGDLSAVARSAEVEAAKADNHSDISPAGVPDARTLPALPPIASRGADEFGQIAAEPLGSIELHGVAHAVVHE